MIFEKCIETIEPVELDLLDIKNTFLVARDVRNIRVYFGQFKTKKGFMCVRLLPGGDRLNIEIGDFDYNSHAAKLNIVEFAKYYNCNCLEVIRKDIFMVQYNSARAALDQIN